MSVRTANFIDTPAIAELMAEAHQRSRYAHTTTFDPITAKRLVATSIQRHGHSNYGGTLVLVSVIKNKIRGFMLGYLDLLYPCLSELKATDLLLYFSEGADPRDVRKMLQLLVTWAEQNPKVIKVELGITSSIIDWRGAAPLYEAAGLTQCGALFEKEFDRAKQEVRRVVSG